MYTYLRYLNYTEHRQVYRRFKMTRPGLRDNRFEEELDGHYEGAYGNDREYVRGVPAPRGVGLAPVDRDRAQTTGLARRPLGGYGFGPGLAITNEEFFAKMDKEVHSAFSDSNLSKLRNCLNQQGEGLVWLEDYMFYSYKKFGRDDVRKLLGNVLEPKALVEIVLRAYGPVFERM